MVKRFVLALPALALCHPALAETVDGFVVPPDVTYHGEVTRAFATGGGTNTIETGTPPGYADQPDNIATPGCGSAAACIATGWTFNPGGDAVAVPYNVNQGEAKVRWSFNASHVLFDDPIRNWGVPGAAHCHVFFGNRGANNRSTYSSLRTRNGSNSAGGPINATAYWMPCPIDSDGKAVLPNHIELYYAAGTAFGDEADVTGMPRGLRFIGGTNMDDPHETIQAKAIAAANTAHGSTRYGQYYFGIGNSARAHSWQCESTGVSSPWLKNEDGTDALGGCPTSSYIKLNFGMPDCWDGTNLWSPGGYKNVRYRVTEGGGQTCADNEYFISTITAIIRFAHNGASDYTNWRFQSDDQAQTKLASLPTCDASFSNAPCKRSGVRATVLNGESFHTDWMDGWDDVYRDKWETYCVGEAGAQPRECGNGQVSAGESGIASQASPDGRTIQVTDTVTPARILVGTMHKGPATVHHSGN